MTSDKGLAELLDVENGLVLLGFIRNALESTVSSQDLQSMARDTLTLIKDADPVSVAMGVAAVTVTILKAIPLLIAAERTAALGFCASNPDKETWEAWSRQDMIISTDTLLAWVSAILVQEFSTQNGN